MKPETNNPIIDFILIGYIWTCEIISCLVVISLTGITSALSLFAVSITIILGIMNLIVVYPKFKQRVRDIKKGKVWADIKEFFGR